MVIPLIPKPQLIFGFLPFGIAISRTGILNHRKMALICEIDNLLFRNIKKRANGVEVHAIPMSNRREGIQPSFIQKAQQKGFHNVFLVMPQSDFIESVRLDTVIEGAFPHFRAQRAGILFFAFLKNNLCDVGMDDLKWNLPMGHKRLQWAIIHPGKAKGYRICLQAERMRIEALQAF